MNTSRRSLDKPDNIRPTDSSSEDVWFDVVEMPDCKTINPINMSPTDAVALGFLLASCFDDNKLFIQSCGGYPLLQFLTLPDQLGFAVISKKTLGEGSFAEVRKVKGVLEFSNTGTLFYKTHKEQPRNERWIARFQKRTSDNCRDAERIFNLIAENKKLGLTYPIPLDDQVFSCVSYMRRLKDKNLDQLLNHYKNDRNKISAHVNAYHQWDLADIFYFIKNQYLSFSKREVLQYSIAIIDAYVEQVLALNILHRDIKPKNIMLNKSGEPTVQAITFTDYDFAIELNSEKTHELRGTQEYIAPEVKMGWKLSHNKSDIYALACTLAEWYGDDGSSHSTFSRRFRLFADAPPQIKNVLNRMISNLPSNRPDIVTVKAAYQEALICESGQGNRIGEELSSSPSLKR